MIRRFKQGVIDRLGITRVARRADLAADGVDDLRSELRSTTGELSLQLAEVGQHLSLTAGEVARRLDELARWQLVERGTAWAAGAPLRATPLVSVVLPTRDRAELLPAAVASVRAQTYERWELVVVDDGSADTTGDVLAAVADDEPRLTVVGGAGAGAAAARNAGLAAATGDWIAFLDDDNTMAPGWLRAVAEYVGRVPDCGAVHGAQLRDDVLGDDPPPWLLFEPRPDLAALRQRNTIDLGMLAVRRDHPELHFDEALELYIDWELVVRLMRTGPIHAMPVLSGYYTSGAGGRISARHDAQRLAEMQRRLAT